MNIKVDDSSLPRPWSAYSLGSSRHQKNNQDKSNNNDNNNSNKDSIKNDRNSNKSKNDDDNDLVNFAASFPNNIKTKNSVKGKKKDQDKDQEDDETLKEFLQVMQPRSKTKTWTNDDESINLDFQNKMTIDNNDDEDDDLYQDLPSSKNKKIVIDLIDEQENINDPLSKNPSISDSEWVKSKMRRRFDLDDEDDEDDDGDDIGVIDFSFSLFLFSNFIFESFMVNPCD